MNMKLLHTKSHFWIDQKHNKLQTIYLKPWVVNRSCRSCVG